MQLLQKFFLFKARSTGVGGKFLDNTEAEVGGGYVYLPNRFKNPFISNLYMFKCVPLNSGVVLKICITFLFNVLISKNWVLIMLNL